jgi:hypothetical protein
VQTTIGARTPSSTAAIFLCLLTIQSSASPLMRPSAGDVLTYFRVIAYSADSDSRGGVRDRDMERLFGAVPGLCSQGAWVSR